MPVIEIDGRIKRLWSISQKLKRQKIELEQVYDFIALRIITDDVEGLLRGARHHPPDVVAGAGPRSRTSSRCRGPTATSRCTPR